MTSKMLYQQTGTFHNLNKRNFFFCSCYLELYTTKYCIQLKRNIILTDNERSSIPFYREISTTPHASLISLPIDADIGWALQINRK